MGTDIHPYAEVRRNGKWEREYVKVPRDRNYWTFAILAGVRNGFGFAGVETGEPIVPIAEPRGLPEDIAWELFNGDENDIEDYDDPNQWVNFGDHSFSHVTLAEMLAYNLDRPNLTHGIINKQQAEELKHGKLPESWCGGKSPMTDNDVRASWSRPLKDMAWLLPMMIDALKPLGAPEDVRIVFGFDS